MVDSARKAPKKDKAFATIFRTEGGKRVDMTKFERRARNPRKVFYISLAAAAGLLLVAALGFFFFIGKDAEYSGNSIALAVTAPDRIATGEDFPLTLKMTNTDKVDLEDFVLTIQYPEEYTLKSTSKSAQNEAKNAFAFGTLRADREQTATLTGNLIGEVGDTVVFGLTYTFRPSNFNYQFTETGRAELTIGAASLTMQVDGPQGIAPNTEGTWTVTVKNAGDEPLDALRVSLSLPSAFSVTGSDPELTDETRWSIDHLAAEEEKSLTFSGTFSGENEEFFELQVTASLVTEGKEQVQTKENILVLLVSTNLTVGFLRNGAPAAGAVAPGENVALTLRYENDSELALDDVSLIVRIADETPADLAAIRTVPGGALQDRTITWTKEEVPALERVKPGASGEVELTFAVLSPLKAESTADFDPQFILIATARVGAVADLGAAGTLESSETLTLPISTALDVSGEARYYSAEGAQVGSGPLPPESGSGTTYIISWFATNSTSDVNGFTATATIPQDVFWTGTSTAVSAGEIAFDPITREIQWTVNTVPAGTGTLSPTLAASFALRITPDSGDVGTTPVLVDTVMAGGTDSATGARIDTTVPSMTTDLIYDTRAQGKGIVVSGE